MKEHNVALANCDGGVKRGGGFSRMNLGLKRLTTQPQELSGLEDPL
jgi:hypothetical protein